MIRNRNLPREWVLTTLGEAFKWGSGGTPKSGNVSFYGGDIPWLVIGDLRDGMVLSSQSTITEAGLRNSSAKWVEPGSVLLAMYGSIGKLGIAGTRLTTNQAIAFTKPNPVETKYLFYYLLSERRNLCSLGIGATQSNISQTTIKSYPFPMAPLPEQRRIVAEIERQFSLLDAGVAALKRVQANLKRYRAAVLQAACTGRLVPTEAQLARTEGREYEPAGVLLERILAERRARWEDDQLARMEAQGRLPLNNAWKARYREPAPPDTTGLPDLPEGWCTTSLEQLTSAVRVICYGILMPKDNVSNGVLYVKVRDMKGDRINLAELHRTTWEIASAYARASLQTGDVLLSIRGTYGRVAEVPAELNGGNITQDTARLDVVRTVDRRYVVLALRNPTLQNYFKRVARGVAVRGVNIADVRVAPVMLPPLDEQGRIVEEVERRFSVVEALETAVTADLKRAERLRQAILKRAFEGKLVPQDPTEEPASVLLERIRAERAASGSVKKARRDAEARPEQPALELTPP